MDLADCYDLTHVVIFCRQGHDGERDCIVTYGQDIEQCEEAAEMGNHLKEVLGWPDNLKEYPSRVKGLQRENKILLERLNELRDLMGEVKSAAGRASQRLQEPEDQDGN